ncbi:MAG: CBS domain-containing protein, partial [Candidatus Bathyarchaeia archaeon]
MLGMLVGTVSAVMTHGVITAGPDGTVKEAATIMRENGIANVVVASKGKPLGILTQRDVLLRVTAEGLDPEKIKIKEVMTSPIITQTKDITLLDAIRTMYENKIRRLPILDEDGILIGIITYRD